jgi:hypothetical protein
MAKLQRRVVSGARVNFDPRTTAEAEVSRDPRNYKSEEQGLRRKRWEARRRKQDN